MTGGILQLVATGKEDEIVTCNPMITMFKTLYRRHTNFDKAEQTLTFNNNLTFGTSASCNIKKLADLVSALTLVIELPDIDISYLPLTNVELALMLKDYGIIWNYDPDNAKKLITQSEFEEVVGKIEYVSGKLIRLTDGMINNQVNILTKTIDKDNKFISTIQEVTQRYISTNNNNLTDYLDELMLELFKTNRELFIDDTEYIDTSDYYNQYSYLYSYKKDLVQLIPQEVSWQDETLIMHRIISFYDPSNGLPIPNVEDRYISSTTDRGWITNSIYRYYDALSTGDNNWHEFSPSIGYGAHITYGYNEMNRLLIRECVGLNKIANGLYDPSADGFPENPTLGDRYISMGNFSAEYVWKNKHVYTWNGTTWIENIPVNGNSIFVIGVGDNYPSYNKRLVYFDGTNWIIYSSGITITYDGFFWRKSAISFYDPTNGLPLTTIPSSLGDTYISSNTANGWKLNNIYVWDGWEWVEKIPSENYGIYIEDGNNYSNSIVVYNGSIWKVLTLPLPLYNFTTFRKFVASTLQNIIFTDKNVELLYAVENCNTTIVPLTAILPIRTFFDNIVTAEIGSIDTNAAVYKSVYNTFFDNSVTGSIAHVKSVQSELSTSIRNEISNVINPNIQMMTTIYNRLQFVDAAVPDYYRFMYYKCYPYTTSYDTTQTVINCPRDNYLPPYTSLIDRFSSYIINISGSTNYITQIKNATLGLVGNQVGSTNGTLYDTILDSKIQSLYNNFFIHESDPLEPLDAYHIVLNSIAVDPNNDAGTRKMYNLPSCMNILTFNPIGVSVKTNISDDYLHFSSTLPLTLGTKGNSWHTLMSGVINYISDNLPSFDEILFPKILWNATDGFLSKISSNPASLDRMVTFIFRYYTPYDVHKILPVDYSFVPSFIIRNKNPIEYLVLTFVENLARFVTYQNNYIDIANKLTIAELNTLVLKIRHIGDAYMCDGLQNYTILSQHRTNILDSVIPELFTPNDTYFKSHHYPYDCVTSMTCYLLEQMIGKFNTYYQTVTNQQIYTDMGDPFMTANEQFVTESDFYVYGNQMYNNGYEMITKMIDGYQNDLDRYDKYGKTLNIKKIFLEKQKYTYNYPLETYIEFHKAFYNNQNIYINKVTSDYDDTYTNILSILDSKILPMLKYLNQTENIFMSPMDMLITTLEDRLSSMRVNPYDLDNDADRHAWYEEKIISNIIDIEVNFDPVPVGLIEYFLGTIESVANPFEPNTYLYNWYNGIDRPKIEYEITKMKELFGLPYYASNSANVKAITPQSLYNDIGNINSKYNSFANNTDFIKYLMDHIIILSQLGYIIPLFKATIPATSEALINYYSLEKSASLDLIDKINPYTLTSVNGSIKYSGLEDIIRNIYNKKPVNFAWISELGHYIIDEMQLIMGDAVIDQITGEFLHIITFTEGAGAKKRGYSRMIGNVPELTTYNNIPKRRYVLYVPMMFTFSKFYEAALPLICMKFVDISVRVKLKKFEDVAYWAPMTKFNKRPKLKCSVIADYIYLDHDERFRMAPLKHEPNIELIQYNGDTIVDLSTTNTTTIRLNFNGTSKELYIVCRMDEYVDGSLPNGEKQWNNYLVKVPKNETLINGETVISYVDVNPIDTIQIKYNGRERETTKDIMFYTCLQRLKHHNVCIYDGINVYSFAITPQLLQPSGAANLGKVGYVDLVIKFRDDVVALVGKNKKTLRVGVYNKSVNILRIMSGLAGLAFYN